MHERISVLARNGKTIVLVDVSDCSARKVEQIAREVPEHVTRQPRGSVLLLTDFTGASIDQEALIGIRKPRFSTNLTSGKRPGWERNISPARSSRSCESSPGGSFPVSRPETMP